MNSAIIDTVVYVDSRSESNLVDNSLPEPLRWDVSYRDYEFNASATLSMNTDNYTISQNDQIAVFVDGVCRGVCKAEYCPLNDQIVFNLMYYSNNLFEDDYQIIYYNSISDKEIDVNETLAFDADTYLGNALEPIVLYEFSIPTEYELSLIHI